MSKLTNMYYSQYESSIESEAAYDSDNSDTHEILIKSPSHAQFYKYIERRNDEELLHESWKFTIREQINLATEIKEQCGMEVNLTDNQVCYIYKPGIDETHIPGIKFKITFIYIKLLRKWYISLGHSRLPDVITLENKVKRGTYNPTTPNILKMIRKIKNSLKIFVQRLEYICKMIEDVKEIHKDTEFEVNKSLTNIKIMLKENAWPKFIEKTSPQDIIILEIVLDVDFKTDNLSYEYIHKNNVLTQQKEICITKLEKKLKIFFDFPLVEAFKLFMDENFSLDEKSLS